MKTYPAVKGVTVYDRDQAWPGLTLFTHTHEDPGLGSAWTARPRLIDMEGRIVHEWEVKTAVQLCKLQPDGTLLYMTRDRSNINEAGLYCLAPDSSVLWHYHCRIDHDYDPLENGNLMIHTITDNMCPALGPGLRRHPYFLEVTPEQELVWTWRGEEHLEELTALVGLEFPIDWDAYVQDELERHLLWDKSLQQASEAQRQSWKRRQMAGYAFDWAHNNTCQVIGPNAAGERDARFRPGNIVFSYRTLDIIGVIDRDSSEIVWAWGPGVIEGQHKPHMLPNGHILIYDNGCKRGYSSIVELDPLTEEVVWSYVGSPPPSFFSAFISGAQRLPNGNTLICEGARGRLFEVTPQGETVWEFKSPYRGVLLGREGHNIYRANRYSAEYAAPLLGD